MKLLPDTSISLQMQSILFCDIKYFFKLILSALSDAVYVPSLVSSLEENVMLCD